MRWLKKALKVMVSFATIVGLSTTMVEQTYATTEPYACGLKTIDLIAGQNYDAGDITIWDDGTNLYFKLVTATGWSFDTLHLDIKDSANLLTNVPGQMPYSQSFNPKATQYTFTIPLASIGLGPEETVYFAFHANLYYSGQDGQRQETGWGNGTPGGGGGWWMYNSYTRCELPPQPVPLNLNINKTVEISPLSSVSAADVFAAVRFTLYNKNTYTAPNGTTYAANSALTTFGVNSSGALVTGGFLVFAGAFYLVETQTHPAYTPSAINIHFSVDKNGVVTYDNPSTTTVNNTLKRTSINIQKYISETTTPLAGVVFGLWAGEGRNGEAIATATSDANGQASFTDLPFGVYTVGELSVPTKFNLDAPDQQVSLQEGGASLQFSNSRITYYGTLKIYKWDNYEMPLDGALFAVYQNIDDETPLRTAISMDGVALFENLPEGTYYYEELSAPTGYTKVNGRTAFTIDEKDEVVEFTVINNRIPRTLTLTLKKFLESHPLFALDPSEVYPSIEFSVYSDEVYIAPNGTQYQPDTLLATFTLHSDGTIDTSGYQTYAGSFYIMETKTHPAYVLNDTKVYFDVNANGEVVYDNPSVTTIDNLLRKANIEVYKYQKGTSTPIEGVVFGLFDNPEGLGDPAYTVTSDATGYAVFENIPFGEYLIKELSVPEAYKMDAPAQSVSLGENGASLSFYNTLKFYGTLQLNKVDHRGAAVNGAVFALYANLNDETPFMSATSVNGVAVFENIPEGTYYYEEVSAPDGYTFVKGRTAITIDEPNEVITKTVVNKPVPQALKIMLPKVLEEHPYFLVEPGIVYAAIQFELYSNEEYVAPDGTIYPKDSLLATFNVGVDGMIDTSGYETYPGSFYLVESKTHDAYLLNTDKVFFRVDLFGTVTYDDESITQIDNWLRKGNLYVTKYVKDTDGMPLAGVTFGLWLGEERDGEPLRTAVSDEYGQVLFEDLPIGMYTVGELAVPDLYKMDAPDQNIYVDEDGTRISFYNSARIFGSLRINKVDYLENPLDGAIFAIYDSMDATTPITSAPIVNGYVIFSDLEEGTYYYEELAAPAGYQPISGRTAFTIDEADEWIEVSVVNNPIPQPLTIDLVKQLERHDFFSIPDSEVFAMISFRLYAASDYVAPDGTMYPADALLATFNVDSNGMIDTGDYETYPGEFYLQEYSTHPAYKLNTNKMYFSVDLFGELTYDDPNMTSILNVLKVGDILISKYIKDTDGQPLEGVTFGLWLGDERVGDPVLTARSDEYGQVRFEDLPYGTYTVGELSVPDRFKMDAPDQIVIVNEDCEKASFYDSARIYGSLRINKVDYKENPLDGAVFAIYDSMDATTPLMSAPIVNGYVIFSDLEEGTYYYEELSAPTGYQTLTGRTAFTIDEAEEWIEVTLVNNPIPRPLTITLPKVLETNALFTVPNEDVYSMIRFELYSADAYLAPNGTTYPAESLLATFKMSDDGYLDTTGYETYPGNFYIVESETHPSFILNTTKIYFSVDLMGNVTYADSSVTNIYNGLRKGDLMIHKYISDTDGETLAGAVFGLWMGSTRSGDPVMMGTSDGEGHVVFEDLPVGTYTVGELSAPDGYVVDVNDQTITLGEDGAMLYFYNDVEVLVGELVIYKWNAFEQPLDGAIFGLYSSMDAQTPLATGVSVNGMVRFEELPLGTYYYEELSAPLGHALIPGRFAVTIEEEGQIVEVNAINDVLYCGTRFIDLIAGQHFDAGDITVWDDGEHLYIFVQAAQYWSFDELHLDFASSIGDIENAPGQMPYKQSFDNATQYTFVIPLADLDEELDLDVRFYFSLHAAMNYDGPDGTREETAWGEGEDYGRDWQMVSWYERCVEPPTPTPLTITLPKVLEDHPLFTLTPAQVYEQIEFTLYNVNEYKGVNGTTYPANTALATFGLTSAGYLDTTGYETYAGDFYIMETKTHPAYMLDDSKVYFSVDEDGVVTYQDSSKTQIDNDLYKGNIWIMKYIAGSDNVPLAGATFGLWLGTTRDDTPDATAISDASGKVEFNALPIGTYTVGELSAPEGYLLDDTDQTITLGEAGEVLYFYNTPDMITGTLKIYKWSECDCLLDGAVFGLFDSLDASEPLFTATTINGVAVFENLPEGTYYYQELAAPAGYILNTNRKMIVIDEKDEVLEVNVINYKYEYGDLIVHKVDLYHGVIPLHGATFALYNAQ
ncbi:MAG: MSCRAMM family protein, partial [Erysipelotrichaceae bacterium]